MSKLFKTIFEFIANFSTLPKITQAVIVGSLAAVAVPTVIGVVVYTNTPRAQSTNPTTQTTTLGNSQNATMQLPEATASPSSSSETPTASVSSSAKSSQQSKNKSSGISSSASSSSQPSATSISGSSSSNSLSDGSVNSSSTPSSSGTTSSSSSLASCGSSYSFFDRAPVNMDDYYGFVPLGNLNPSGHVFPSDHIYLYKRLTNTVATLYAPGDITFVRMSASQNITAGTTDYSIYFSPCSQLEVYFLHVLSITSALNSALVAPYQWDSTYTTGGNTYRSYGKNVNIVVNSGTEIGTVKTFDMGASDTRVTLNFINPNARSNSTHTVCPIDYYSGSL